jgi:outer membrane protein TolC
MIIFPRAQITCLFLIGMLLLGFNPLCVQAVDLDFDTMLSQALEHSYDIAIAEKNIDISRLYTEEVRALYYPTLTLQAYNEYVDLFGEDDEVVTTGDYVSPYGESMFQDSVTARMVYLLYDFGVRDLKSAHAVQGERVSRLETDQVSLAVRQEVLERYAKALSIFTELKATQKICERRRNIYGYIKRLSQAGTVDQIQVETVSLNLSEALTRIDDLTIDYQTMLDLLGFYTGRSYSATDNTLTMLADPGESIPSRPIDPRLLPEVLALEVEIARKEKEYAISRKEMLPQFYLNGGFSMYGNDTTNVFQSLENLRSRDGSISLVAQWKIFSGFGDKAKSLRLKEEAARMNLEKEKRLATLSLEIQTASHTYELYQADEKHCREYCSQIGQSRMTLDRLARQEIWDQVTLLENDIRLIEHELDLELKLIKKAAAGLKLKFWVEGQRS